MTRSRWFRLVALLATFVLIGASCGGDDDDGGPAAETCPDDEFGCVEVAQGDPITIGSLLVISGPNASLGTDSQRGVELAIDNLDDSLDATGGQLLGHDVRLVAEDDGCAAEGGQAGGRSLATNPDIVAVIGTSCSSAAVPASQILSEEGIILFSSSNTGPNLTDPDLDYTPFYARTAHNDLIQGAAMAQFVGEELQLTTAATIHDGSPYAEGLANAFAAAFQENFGGEVTTQEAVQVGQTEMRPVLTSVAADSPEFLYYPVFIPEGAAITQQARETEGLEETDLAGADGMLSPDFVDAAGDSAEGMYLSGPDLSFKGDFYKGEFLPAYEDQYGEEPTAPFHAHAYDAANVVFEAIEEVAVETDDGGLLIPRTQLRDAVYATDYEGILGQISCNDTGDCLPETTIAVNEVKNGEFDPIFSVTLSLEEVSG
ncbi:MAG: branched-chain amino acid ABC transporter substrate-binding protein [Actinomycetota bacterium]